MVPWVQGRPCTLGPSVFRSYYDVVDMVQLSRGPPSATEVNVDDLPISPGMLASDDPDSPGPARPVRPQGRAAGESSASTALCCVLHVPSSSFCCHACFTLTLQSLTGPRGVPLGGVGIEIDVRCGEGGSFPSR